MYRQARPNSWSRHGQAAVVVVVVDVVSVVPYYVCVRVGAVSYIIIIFVCSAIIGVKVHNETKTHSKARRIDAVERRMNQPNTTAATSPRTVRATAVPFARHHYSSSPPPVANIGPYHNP